MHDAADVKAASHRIHRVEVSRGLVEVAFWGPPVAQATPILLLHEGLGSVAAWKDVPAEIARRTGQPVVAYSRFGHGRSDPPAAKPTVHFMHHEARCLPELLDVLGISRACLLGHSDGGSIALIFAAEHPHRVSALILEAPHVFVEDLSVASIARITHAYRTTDLRQRLAKYHDHVDLAFSGWSDVWLDPAFRSWNVEALLPSVRCPLLLVQGTDDEYGTLQQVEAIARQVRGPLERLVLPDCGHAPHRDQRDTVLAAITAFVQRYVSTPAPPDRSTAE